MKALAYVLIIAGLAMSLSSGFTFITKEKVIDAGPIEINKEEKHPVSWSPIIGVVMLVAGIVVLVTVKKKN